MTVEDAIFVKLTGTAAVAALVDDRVYLQQAPDSIGRTSYVIYTRIAGPRIHSMSGPSGLAHPMFQIMSFAPTARACRTLADAVRVALDGYAGTVTDEDGNTCAVRGALLKDEADIPISDPDVEQATEYGIRQDYTIWHDE